MLFSRDSLILWTNHVWSTVSIKQGAAEDKGPSARKRRIVLYLAEKLGSDNSSKLTFVQAGRLQTLAYNDTLDSSEKSAGLMFMLKEKNGRRLWTVFESITIQFLFQAVHKWDVESVPGPTAYTVIHFIYSWTY